MTKPKPGALRSQRLNTGKQLHEARHSRSLRNVLSSLDLHSHPTQALNKDHVGQSTGILSYSEFSADLNMALKEYKKKTGKELTTHPLTEEIKGCSSPEAILAILQGKANELNQSQSSDERLTKWLTPTVNVLNALSATLGQGVGTVSHIISLVTLVLMMTFRYFPPPRSSLLGSISSLW